MDIGCAFLNWHKDILLDYEVAAYRLPTREEARSLLRRIEDASTEYLQANNYPRPNNRYTAAEIRRRWGTDWLQGRHGLGVHWTACACPHRSLSALLNPSRQVSTHFLIHWDGTIIQLYPLDVATWHGAENRFRIGVDFVHPGWLTEASGQYHDWAGRPYPTDSPEALHLPAHAIPDGHRHHHIWASYTCQQLRSLVVLGRLLKSAVPFRSDEPFLKGHHQVNPRKSDVWHFPLLHMEQDILTDANTLDPTWWGLAAVEHQRDFVIRHREAGTL